MTRVTRHLTADLIMEEWLDMQGFYVKHTAKDGSCLFRAVSEQVFYTQSLHEDVRRACINYMERNHEQFEEFVEGSFESHLNNLRDPKEWAGQVEMTAMSQLFVRDFLVFYEVGQAPFKATDNNFEDKIMLYFSQGNHYDSVYSKSYFVDAAVCQSIVYDMLYKKVYQMGDEVDLAVEKMLHDKNYAKLRKDSTASLDSNCGPSEIAVEVDDDRKNWNDKDTESSEVRRALFQGYPPFPYKVAKALDPEIYRNVEFDIWNENHKEETLFEPGVKCLVRLDKDKPDSYQAHIQEVSPNKGPVSVYIVELGEKQMVPYENLEPLPLYNKGWQAFGRRFKAQSTHYRQVQFSRNTTETVPCHTNMQSRLPSHQTQFASSFLPIGRGRSASPYYGNSRNNTSQNAKWQSGSSSQHQRCDSEKEACRYHGRIVGSRYFTSNGGNNHSVNNHSRDSFSGNYRGVNSNQNFDKSNSTTTSVTWINSIDNVQSTHPYAPSSASNGSTGNESVGSQQHNNDHGRCFSESVKPSLTSSMTTPHSTVATSESHSTAMPSSSIPSSENPCALPSLLNAVPESHQNGPVQAMMTPTTVQSYGAAIPPQPVAIFPCQYFTGICVPYELPLQPVNFSVSRSQDPNGNDLPFQDVATLRFFFNLGCDYFRVASVVQISQSSSQYPCWNYGTQVGYSPTVNGFPTPTSGSETCEVHNETLSSTEGTAAPSSETSNGEVCGTPMEEMYEPATYVYSSSPVSFVPGVWTQPVDYNTTTAIPGLVTDFKNGLVLNEQGVLTLSPTPCPPPTFCVPPPQPLPPLRQRSDSGSSGHSQRENVDWNRGGCQAKIKANSNMPASYEASYKNGYTAPTSRHQQQFSPQDGGMSSMPPRLQQKRNVAVATSTPSKLPPSYVSQSLVQLGVSPPPPPSQPQAFPIGSPLIFSGGSPVGAGALFAPAYYSPPHHHPTATLVYSPTHHHPYMPASAH